MLEVGVAHSIARWISVHEMALKLLQKGVRAFKITLVRLDAASCDFFDVEDVWKGMSDIFCVNSKHVQEIPLLIMFV